MTNPGFIDFLSLMESQQGTYSIEFGSNESDYQERMGELFMQNLNQTLSEKVDTFVHEVTGDPASQVRIKISPNPSNIVFGLMKDRPIEIIIDRPLNKITSKSIWEGLNPFRRSPIKGIPSVKTFIEERKGDHIIELLFVTDLENLDKLFYEVSRVVARSATGLSVSNQDLEKDMIPTLYKYFLSEDAGKQYSDEVSRIITSEIFHRAVTSFLKKFVSSKTGLRISGETLDQVISLISSDSKDDAQRVRSTFMKLMSLSEEGRPDAIESSYDLSKLVSALMDTHGTPTKVSNSVKHRF
jgi:hypothetical protein